MSHAVEVVSLTKRFDDVTAVDDVTFAIDEGALFGFIGPDGAGKTTLFRILATLLVPSAGSATVLGRDVVRELWALRREIGYMPGRFSLYPDLSVDENLRFFATVFGTTVQAERAQIEPIYAHLAPFGDRRAKDLSGGMKQKLALCCALVHRPRILLLDEPTTGVDAVSRREFWDLLGTLRDGGLTIVASTPYMDEADRCDRVALMHQGRLLAVDAPRAISAAYDRPLLAIRAPDRFRALHAARAFTHARSVYPFGETLHYADARADAAPDEIARELAEHLRAENVTDVVVAPTAPTIEDAFIARMTPSSGSGDDSRSGSRTVSSGFTSGASSGSPSSSTSSRAQQ